MDRDKPPKLVVKVAKEFAKKASLDPVSAKALVDTVANETSREKLLFFVQDYPDVMLKFIGECARRLEEAYSTINGLGTKSVEQQVAVTLLKLAESIGKKEESNIILDISLQDLAEIVGHAQENVSRVVTGLKRKIIVEWMKTKIIIFDMERLQLIAEGNGGRD